MNWKAIAIVCAAAAGYAVPAPALAQSGHSLRNDTGQIQNCRLDRPHSSVTERIILRPGQEWSGPARSGATRRLVCNIGEEPLQVMLREGLRYALVQDPQSGMIVVRVVPPR